VEQDQTIDVVIRWDHRITDAALIAKVLTRLEAVLTARSRPNCGAAGNTSNPSPFGRSRPENIAVIQERCAA